MREVIDREREQGREVRPISGERPTIRYREWLNKRTGQVERVPEGIDPGWDTNPGKTRLLNAQRMLAGKLEGADAAIAQAALRDLVQSPLFEDFLRNPQGEFPALRLADNAAEAIGSKQRVARLSAETMQKQLAHHPELTAQDYRALPEMGAAPRWIVQDGEQTVVIVGFEGKLYRAVVKATKTGEGLFVTSFRRSNERDVAALVKAGKILLGG